MVVKKQHIIPRCYLKHFINENGKVFAYNIFSNLYIEKSIEDICTHKYAYETSKSKVNNILENELSSIESNLSPYLDMIIEKSLNGTLKRTDIDNKLLFKYIMLLHIRTDSNRILYSRALFEYTGMDHHMELPELKKNRRFIKLFNARFNSKGSLNHYLEDLYYKTQPEIRIGIAQDRKFITSDNPVILFYIPEELSFECIKYVLPIHPNICIYYYGFDTKGYSKVKQPIFPYLVPSDTVIGYNQGIINVANYWIISSEPFSMPQDIAIYRRFHT